MFEILWLVLICVTGYLAAYVLALPAPGLLGPMLMVVLTQAIGVDTYALPASTIVGLQILLGIYIGGRLTRQSLIQLRTILKPVIITCLWVLVITFGLGVLLAQFSGESLLTTILSVAPAGVSEISMLSISIGANTTYVSFFQLSRFLLTLWIYPLLAVSAGNPEQFKFSIRSYFRSIEHRRKGMYLWFRLPSGKSIRHLTLLRMLFPILIGTCGGLLARKMGIPAGPLIGSFLAIALVSAGGVTLHRPPLSLRLVMQMGMGATIGKSMVGNSHLIQTDLILMMGAFTLSIFICSYVLYRVLRRCTSWDEMTCLLASAPAGIMVMTLLADELKASTLEVSLVHLARQLTVKIFIVPVVLAFFL